MRLTNKHSRHGFTLVELVVVTAITAVILSAIVALFVFALRTVQSGRAAMDANELTRAAFAAIERDLNSAFTSREHGELFHFHGNEVGMSFIGMVRTYDANANRDVVQLGRVTYVINESLNPGSNGIDDDGDGQIDEADEKAEDLIYMETLDITTDEMIDAQLEGEIAPGVRTVALIRYFEPGVDSLDIYDPDIAAEFEDAATSTETQFQELFTRPIEALELDGVSDAQLINEVERNARRDAYIRMLAQQDGYPDGWALLEPAPNGEPRNPIDYVIADNILDRESQMLLEEGDPFYNPVNDQARFPYFRYGRTITTEDTATGELLTIIEYAPTWNANENVLEIMDNPRLPPGFGPPIDVDLDENGDGQPDAWQTIGVPGISEVGSPLRARLPEFVNVRLPFIFDSPYAGAPHVARTLENDIRVPTAYQRRNPLVNPI